MNRRESLAALLTLGGMVPFVANAQPPEKKRKIGVLMPLAASDPIVQPDLAAFQQALADLGWRSGANIAIEYRWGANNIERIRNYTRELIALQSEVIVSRSTLVTKAVVREAKAVPIVFVQVSDPVGDGLVATMARPGANVTGFTNVVDSMSGKWLELLKEISPGIAHVAMLYSPKTSPGRDGAYFVDSFEAAGRSLGVRTSAVGVEQRAEIEAAIGAAVSALGGALILAPSTSLTLHRDLIVTLATRNRLPAIYPFTYWTDHGGLMSYGTDTADLFRRSASYVDRILKGAKPAELPVQAPTKFVLSINRRAAAAIGLDIPQSILLRADQVIE